MATELIATLTDRTGAGTPDLHLVWDEANQLYRLTWPTKAGDWNALTFRPDGARWPIRTQPVPAEAPFERDPTDHVHVEPG